jgi:hypothetical protein
MAYKIYDNVVGLRDATAEETIQIDAREKEWADNSESRKLGEIKEIRERKLKETDYLALSDTTLSVTMSDYRQSLRDIPQNNTTEEQYDLILARVDGQLTHAIWSKP